jgi:hypothetical protein
VNRVAIYALPGTGSDADGAHLRERAESWLGRRVDGRPADQGVPDGWTRAAVDEITVDARRYGFHGTLKPPFRPAPGRSLGQLEQDLARFAAGCEPVAVPQLTLTLLDGFFALVPGDPARELYELAAALVTGFDRYRAPATAAETARRNPSALTPAQRRMLATWGYPYVLDEFRFHLTLTDRIPSGRRPAVHDALTAWFADCLGRTVTVDALTLFTEPAPGAPFRLHSVHPLRLPAGAPPRVPAHEGIR